MPRGDRPPEPLAREEVRALLLACSPETLTGMRNRALLVVLWRAGLRCAEALALRPCDVDFGAGTIRVRFGKGRKARTVGVDDEALAVVRAWLGAREAAGVASDFLFCDLKRGYVGHPMRPRYVRAEVARIARRAGVGHRVHPHGLRHTHAVELRREGWDIPLISRQLGHASIATTAIYVDHLYPSEVVGRARARSWGSVGHAVNQWQDFAMVPAGDGFTELEAVLEPTPFALNSRNITASWR
jgi:integrase